MHISTEFIGQLASMLIFPLLCLLLPFLYLIIVKFNLLKHPQLPPGPHPWPLVGNIFHMGKKPHLSLADLARTHGQLMSLRLGGQLVVVASSPVAAIEIFRTHDRTLSGRYVPAVVSKIPKIVDSSIAMSAECNEKWKFLRGICHAELFSAKAMESQATLREKKMGEMVEYLRTRDGETVKVSEIVFTTITNSLSNFMMSKDVVGFESGGESGRMKVTMKRIVELITAPSLADLYPGLDGVDVWCKRNAKHFDSTVKLLWTDIIKARRDQRGKHMINSSRDLLDALIENSLPDDNIGLLFMELMTAGTDTTCSTIEWTMAELIKNQQAMDKVRDEVEKSIKGSSSDVPSMNSLYEFPYLQACVKEAMRLHPSGPFLVPRRALQTCKVMGYTIPKDSLLLVNFWAIGTDPAIWDDHLSFKPERFLDDDEGLGFRGTLNFKFLPFGAGRRMCPGLPMAAQLIQLAVAFLVHYFDWFLPHGMDPRDLDMNAKFGTTLQMQNPLLLISTPRKHP